ncbi:hypothetical protein [Streptomyces sp. NPDC001500]
MEFDASFPSDGEAFELEEQGEGLLDDVAELAQALDVLPLVGTWWPQILAAITTGVTNAASEGIALTGDA